MKLHSFSTTHHCSHIKFHHSSSSSLFSPFSSTTVRRRNHRWPRMDAAEAAGFHRCRRKDKVVVIMGGTGAGKSRLSIDLANHFSLEIINSDKMQVYRGLDITTNKIPIHERNGVVHHLLGDIDPEIGDFTPSDFRSRAGNIIADIASRSKLPVVVGGSNSFVHALLAGRFDPELNMFDSPSPSLPSSTATTSSISSELRYECCFLWVDVSFPVLTEYLLKRVDDMLDSGMVEELAEFFDPDSDDLEDGSANRTGLRKAIGVPEFDRFFMKYPPPLNCSSDLLRKGAYDEAVRAIKDNTCQLVERQIGKISRLREAGWDLRRLDATAAFRAKMAAENGGERWSEIWEREVVEPSVKIVKRFLRE